LIDFIRVGGTTEVEVKEKKDRVADATQPGRPLNRASFPGGGIGPCSPSRRWANLKLMNDNQKTGLDLECLLAEAGAALQAEIERLEARFSSG